MNAVLHELVAGPIAVGSHVRTAVSSHPGDPGFESQLLLFTVLVPFWRKLRTIYQLEGTRGALERGLRYLFDNAFRYWWAIRNQNAGEDPATADSPVVVEIDPAEHRYQSRFTKAHFPTKDGDTKRSPVHDEPIVGVLGGRWDRFRTEWSETRIHRSLEARFVDGEPWETTAKYRYASCKIENELEDWRSSSLEELEQRCADLEALYDSMAEEGYVPQTELLERGEDERMETGEPAMKPIHGTDFPHEMRVGIGRHGELIRFGAGKHRLSIAKLLGIESVPVVVVVRHERWAAIRNAFAEATTLEDVPERYREYADHPDVRSVHDGDATTNVEAEP